MSEYHVPASAGLSCQTFLLGELLQFQVFFMSIRNNQAKHPKPHIHGYKKANEYRALSRSIFEYANRALPRVDFLNEISLMLVRFFECDAVELWLKEGE